MKYFRTNGAVGALLDEYEKSIDELIHLVRNIQRDDLVEMVDEHTTDEDCRSIQSILSHVVHSGHVYLVEIRKHQGEEISYPTKSHFVDVQDYVAALKDLFLANERLFEDYSNLALEEVDPSKKMLVRWGQRYDVEQLFEHAIVHVLRHRRQIQRFLQKLSNL